MLGQQWKNKVLAGNLPHFMNYRVSTLELLWFLFSSIWNPMRCMKRNANVAFDETLTCIPKSVRNALIHFPRTLFFNQMQNVKGEVLNLSFNPSCCFAAHSSHIGAAMFCAFIEVVNIFVWLL